jgi:outer membrane receptor protein involved in Fe transport
MRKFSSIAIVLCFVLLIAGVSPLLAQTANQGSVEGTITDPSGAVIPGATLTASNTATGVVQSTQSNADGYYRFIALPVGAYDLTINKSGFAAQTRKGIDVSVGGKIALDIKLGVSSTEQTVNVTEETPLVETTRTNVSTTVNASSVRDLPVNGRNFLDFVLLTPGVARDVRGGDLSFAGQRGTLNSLTVDGADDNNTFFGQTTGRTGSGRAPYQFSQDAVQEFQVNTNGYSAELGHAGGAIINVVTKSGTNNFHGTGFEFFRDRGLAANDPIVKLNHAFNPALSLRKPGYHFHQFGGNIGGPIVKNRAFFFFDYDGQRNTQGNVPTLALPSGFTPTTSFQTAALNYLNARTAPFNKGLNQDTYMLKGDWSIASSQQLSVRWNRQKFTGLNFENGPTLEHTGSSLVNSDTVTGQLTSTLTPSIVNVVRINWLRDNEPGQANSNLPEATVRQAGQTLLTVGRNSFSPRFTNINRMESSDTVTWVHRTHTLKTGYDYIHDNIANFFPGNFSGVYSFNSLENFGRSLAGQPLITTAPGAAGDSFLEAFAGPGTIGATTHPNITEFSVFLQDDWRVRNNLTLNLGVRYDIQNTAKPPGLNPTAAAVGIFTNRLETDKNNIAPRLGFAWQPLQNGRTVVRGGYGMFYGRTPSIFVGTAHNQNGISIIQKTFFTTDIPAYPNTKCGAPVASPSCAPPTAGTAAPPTILFLQPKYVQPVVQQANLNVEHQITNDVSITVGYQYVKGNHLQRTRDINLGTPVPTAYTIATGGGGTYLRYAGAAGNPTRPIAGFLQMFQFESSASSLYHGGFIQLKKRMSRNFQGQVAYTYSHVIDDRPDATAVVPGTDNAKMLFDPKCDRCDRANGDNDQRHRFVVSGIWTLNYANSLSKPAQVFLGGWEMSTIFTAQSGQPYTGKVGSDFNNDGNSATDRVPQEGRNTFVAPNTWSLDPRFTKTFNFNERARLQLMVEAFNITNHFNVTGVRTTQYSVNLATNVLTPVSTGVSAFGMPSSGGLTPNSLNGARIFQLGAKITF